MPAQVVRVQPRHHVLVALDSERCRAGVTVRKFQRRARARVRQTRRPIGAVRVTKHEIAAGRRDGCAAHRDDQRRIRNDGAVVRACQTHDESPFCSCFGRGRSFAVSPVGQLTPTCASSRCAPGRADLGCDRWRRFVNRPAPSFGPAASRDLRGVKRAATVITRNGTARSRFLTAVGGALPQIAGVLSAVCRLRTSRATSTAVGIRVTPWASARQRR